MTLSAQSTLQIDQSLTKGCSNQTFEQLINNLNQDETANLSIALANYLPEEARDSIQVKIIDRSEAERDWANYREFREGFIHTFGDNMEPSTCRINRLSSHCLNLSKIFRKSNESACKFPGQSDGNEYQYFQLVAGGARPDYHAEQTGENSSSSSSQSKRADQVGGGHNHGGKFLAPPASRKLSQSQLTFNPASGAVTAAPGSVVINDVHYRGPNSVLSFDEAMTKYSSNTERPRCFRMAYQHVILLFMTLGIISSNCISFGLPMLIYDPLHLHGRAQSNSAALSALGIEGTGIQCFKRNHGHGDGQAVTGSSWMSDAAHSSKQGHWTSCHVQDICNQHGAAPEWRIDPKHPEHMRNWNQKFNLICKP